jgi:hypothetical protein
MHMNATSLIDSPPLIVELSSSVGPDGSPTERTQRIVADLLRQTHANRAHPFAVIDWNAPVHQIDPHDPVWVRCCEGPIAPRAWFDQLSTNDRARFAMERICCFFLAGIEFETGLSTGLLRYAQRPGISHHVYAYIYEEIIEEAQHSLMFRTLVERCAPDLIPLAGANSGISKIAEKVATYALESPLLFLAGVLCGEEPIDSLQRSFLRKSAEQQHPLVRSVCALHVAEEARHLRFARCQMREMLSIAPLRDATRVKRFMPFLMNQMSEHILSIPDWLAKRWEIPASALESSAWIDDQRTYQAMTLRKLTAFARSCDLIEVK